MGLLGAWLLIARQRARRGWLRTGTRPPWRTHGWSSTVPAVLAAVLSPTSTGTAKERATGARVEVGSRGRDGGRGSSGIALSEFALLFDIFGDGHCELPHPPCGFLFARAHALIHSAHLWNTHSDDERQFFSPGPGLTVTPSLSPPLTASPEICLTPSLNSSRPNKCIRPDMNMPRTC